MTNQKKVLIGVGVLALLGYFFIPHDIFKQLFNNTVVCAKPLVKCPNNNTCYDPNGQYVKDPCSE